MPKVKIAGNYNSYLYFDHDGRRFAQKTGTFGKLEHAAAAQDSLQACFKEDAPIDDKELERQFVNGNMSTVLEYLEAAPPAEAARAAARLMLGFALNDDWGLCGKDAKSLMSVLTQWGETACRK